MNLQPRIERIESRQVMGMKVYMNLANHKTQELWRGFMPRRHEIEHLKGSELVSMAVYDPELDFRQFTPLTFFDKWAAVEVTTVDKVPDGMETYTIPGGLYAVFLYKGLPQNFRETFDFIFKVWLPASAYTVDMQRPHFEIMGEKYNNTSPDSEEDIWIPVLEK